MPGELLTANQAAERLQIHLMTVYRWIKEGRLQAKRLPGGGLRIEAVELEKLLVDDDRESHANSKK